VLLALTYPGLKVLFLRRTLGQLYENHILPLLGMLQGIARYSSQTKTFIFPNGSRIRMGYCDNDTDVQSYQGLEEDVIFYEEATQFKQAWIEFINTCNRSTRSDFKPRIYYTTNPGGVSHAYFKRLFIDKQYKDNEKPGDYDFIAATVYDNDILMKNNPEYIDVLLALPEHLRKAHLEGDWNAMAGQFFSEFRETVHVVEPFEVPESWLRFKALDWGSAKPYAVVWGALDYDGCMYIYRELYGCKEGEFNIGTKETAVEVARSVKKAETEKTTLSIADPAIWIKTGSSGPSIYEDFCSEGVYFSKAVNDRLQGWQQVRNRLKGDKHGPKIKIFDTCEHLIRTLPMLSHDKHRLEDVNSDEEDHLADALRYLLMARPWSPTPEKQNAKKIDRYKTKKPDDGTSWMAR
jgi:phage terminase large subunit